MNQEALMARRLRVRELEVLRLNNPQIILRLREEKFKISRTTLTKDLQAIRREDGDWMDELSRDEFTHQYRVSLEVLKKQQYDLQEVYEHAQTDMAKISAKKTIAEIETVIIQLLEQGPTVKAIRDRLRAIPQIPDAGKR